MCYYGYLRYDVGEQCDRSCGKGSEMADEAVEKQEICQFKEWTDGGACGRPIHPASEHDLEPVCLMHSRDPHKSDEEFKVEFERILAQAKQENGWADFSGFKFPASDYSGKIFEVECNFGIAEFATDASFYGATFRGDVRFERTTFTGDAIFNSATFKGDAGFRKTTFRRDATFDRATFEGNATLFEATFTGDAEFSSAMFFEFAKFDKATFAGGVRFNKTTFEKDAIFDHATFTEDASFEEAELPLLASFRDARFLEGARFRETSFRHDDTLETGLEFVDARLEHPERIEFYKTYLGQSLFYNTDVSKIDFTLVDWRKRGHRSSLFEEALFIDEADFYDLDDLDPVPGSEDQLSHGLIAETYQQLKRNYDAKGDYWTAGHFHYGEMEMLRLHSRFRWKPLQWLERNLGLTALYKYGSAYGESMSRPLTWLVAIVLLFALLFPLAGLTVNPNQGEVGFGGWQVDYWNAGQFFQQHPQENPVPRWVRWVTRDRAATPLLVHSGMTALSVAGFQKELRYSPVYPWGRALALLELLLTTTLGGLFLLAIRRQYKRS